MMFSKVLQGAYQQAVSELEAKSFASSLHTIVNGSLGHWLNSSQKSRVLPRIFLMSGTFHAWSPHKKKL